MINSKQHLVGESDLYFPNLPNTLSDLCDWAMLLLFMVLVYLAFKLCFFDRVKNYHVITKIVHLPLIFFCLSKN